MRLSSVVEKCYGVDEIAVHDGGPLALAGLDSEELPLSLFPFAIEELGRGETSIAGDTKKDGHVWKKT